MVVALPKDLEEWARAEVAAGRADSVDALTADALGKYRLAREAFWKSLGDSATEANLSGWIAGDDVLAELDQWIAEDEAEAEVPAS